MIEGLRLTMSGEEVRMLIERRAAEHRAKAERWRGETARTPDDETEDTPLLPEHICENEATRHEWRAERLSFLRDHLDPSEVYRLGEMDLEFAELVPEPPELLGPDDSEDSEILNPDHVRNAERR
jgi:hypothetical protein